MIVGRQVEPEMALPELTEMRPGDPMRKIIKILIVTDYLLLCEGIERILESISDIEVVGRLASIEEAIKSAEATAPDVMIVDLSMIETGSQRLLDYLYKNNVSTKILLLTGDQDEDLFVQKLNRGIHGCLSRKATSKDLIKAIYKVNSGELWPGRKTISKLANVVYNSPMIKAKKLSRREEEIAMLISQGLSNKEIAQKLCISEKTVKYHITSIFKKMEVKSRLKIALQFLPEKYQIDMPKL